MEVVYVSSYTGLHDFFWEMVTSIYLSICLSVFLAAES